MHFSGPGRAWVIDANDHCLEARLSQVFQHLANQQNWQTWVGIIGDNIIMSCLSWNQRGAGNALHFYLIQFGALT